MPTFPYRLVTVDIDGTLTAGHGWRYLAERRGRLPAYYQTQSDFTAGRSDENVHLRHLLDLASGASRRELDDIVRHTPRVPGIRSGVARLHASGAKVALLTHNPAYICDWYREAFGFDASDGIRFAPKFHAGLAQPPDDRVVVDKIGGARRLAARFGVRLGQVAHVGDGVADAEAFPTVGLGVAFGATEAKVRAAADLIVKDRDFRAVVAALSRTPPARPEL
jgi:phosphoserine phosphatase